MDREKQIDEIINTIDDVNEIYVREVDETGFSDIGYSDRYAINKKVAEALYNAGYRKVPFGSVILTPEQRDEEMKACNEKQAELEAEIERLKLENQAASDSADTLIAEQDKFAKEQRRLAVKEFASKLKDKAVDFLYSAAVDGHPGFDINISELCHMIDELLEENE